LIQSSDQNPPAEDRKQGGSSKDTIDAVAIRPFTSKEGEAIITVSQVYRWVKEKDKPCWNAVIPQGRELKKYWRAGTNRPPETNTLPQ
jgi:hypothetical protein